MRLDTYRLDEYRQVVPSESFDYYDRFTLRTSIFGSTVSTVFLALNHNYLDGPPVVFETMVFSDYLPEYMTRCSTYPQALRMHIRGCFWVLFQSIKHWLLLRG